MDISRLPVAPLARPASTTIRANRPPAVDDTAPRVERLSARPRTRETLDNVVQGELLQRQRDASYQSTRAFIDERNLNHARPAGEQSGNVQQVRSAIIQYANNVRPEPRTELTQGRSVNYFV